MPERERTYAPRRSRKIERTPDAEGMVSINLKLNLPFELYQFIEEQSDREKRSISTMAVMQLEAYKKKLERLEL